MLEAEPALDQDRPLRLHSTKVHLNFQLGQEITGKDSETARRYWGRG